MNQRKIICTTVLLVWFHSQHTVGAAPEETVELPVNDSELDARAGPFDVRPTLPTTTASAKPSSTESQPLGGATGLLGGGGLPELVPGGQPAGAPATPQSALILGAFQAIITPFNPGMLGSVIGALGGGGGNIGGGGGGPPSLPSFPIGSKPQT
ncbi:ESX-1 secretion-associated protein EspB-like [Anopheles marshallii]|uniref:ESX-1 secretion-associated protein EspB-like n=1 Tax=Anopheles marshallii TaxID=1521116 RepID=UPI00237B8662|nr:ESX-1 secretion-associated protein EspB-like [Anopheles marshallii]